MADGKVRGYFVMGENPVVGSMHGGCIAKAMRELDWCVVRDFAPTETAEFWRTHPRSKRRGRRRTSRPRSSSSPAPPTREKDGTFTNTQRLLQWHHKAVEPKGDCRSELHFMYPPRSTPERALRRFHRGQRSADPGSDLGLPDDRPARRTGRRSGAARDPRLRRRRRVTGDRLHATSPTTDRPHAVLDLLGLLRRGRQPERHGAGRGASSPGSRPSGAGRGRPTAGSSTTGLRPTRGQPWSERKRYVWWDEEPDAGPARTRPTSSPTGRPDRRPGERAVGLETIGGDDPFIMQSDGQRMVVRADGTARRSPADALRAAGIGGRERALRTAMQSRSHGVETAGQPATTEPTTTPLPLRRHDLSA